ncbi:hypothetical protein ACIRPX_35600 [Streptomyces sp. NPDC101225]|uniref:hypothetical protein n=1 Tax=Streptomyces sp. NPDC101225 TaxID=3366135 RepID=UPI003829B2DF
MTRCGGAASGPSRSTRRILAGLLLARTRTIPLTPCPADSAGDDPVAGARPTVTGAVLGYSSDVVEVVETIADGDGVVMATDGLGPVARTLAREARLPVLLIGLPTADDLS